MPGDNNDLSDVFVRDLVANTTTRVSVDENGAQATTGGQGGDISADGLKIAFESDAKLVSVDTNGEKDVYVRNTQAGTTVRASVGTGGVQGIFGSFSAAIDDAGTHVAFVSFNDNFDLGGDTNNSNDVFWRDLGSDTTILVSRATGPNGALGDADSEAPAISGDGLGVAFESGATNLGAGTPPPNARWIYLRRLGTNDTSVLSRASGAAGAVADAFAASVSLGTAPTVAAFVSGASNLDADASGEFSEVFKRDLSGTPATTLVSRPSGTNPRSALVNHSFMASPQSMSADGRLVLFSSSADGLDPAAPGRFTRAFVRDTVANTTTLVSRAPGPDGAAPIADVTFNGAAMGADGTHVVFMCPAKNLLEGVTGLQVYVRNLTTGGLEVASRADGPAGALSIAVAESGGVTISAAGRRVAFTAADPLVSADTGNNEDVYVRDLDDGTTTLVSVSSTGGAGDDRSRSPSLSDDGTRVAFISQATNLLGSGPTSGQHVFVRDLVAGTTVLADRRADDGTPGTGRAETPVISGAGNRVTFFAPQALTSEAIASGGAIYVRDLTTDTTVLASRADGADGVAVTSPFAPSLNRDGTRVGFVGTGTALPGGQDTLGEVYVRDLAAGTTRLVSAVDGTPVTPANFASFGPAMSAGGGCIAFGSYADNLTTPGYPTHDFEQVYVRDVDGECPASATTTTTLPPGSGTPIAANAVVLKPGKVVKLVAKGLSGLPVASSDPTSGGGSLTVAGTTGSVSFALPASGWKAIGRRQPKGFTFKGGRCRVTLLRRKILAACHGDTGGLRLPEPGPLDVTLVAGAKAYCAACGGTPAGRATRVFKRKACPAPATCP